MLEGLAKAAECEEDIPPAIRNKPVLDQFQLPYWQAYLDITGSRQFTASGIADIPYSEKIAWLDENDITDQDERNDYMQMISALDGTYLEHYYKKNKVT